MGLFVRYLEKEMKNIADGAVLLNVIGDIVGFKLELQ